LKSGRTVSLLVACGGAAGACSRYGVELAMPTLSGRWPWGTFLVNVTGSLLIGVVLVMLTERFPTARTGRPFLVTGFLGGYTTFSTYTVESVQLARAHDYFQSGAYVVASALAGLVAVIAGALVARFLLRPAPPSNHSVGS
jgi:CrcB protein